MRLRRVRITLGTLVFVVALVAANFWAYRFVCERVGPTVFFPYFDVPIEVGIFPLLDVALLGTWLHVARRVRCRVRGRRESDGSSVPGVTYFSLHLLLLGVVAYLFVPDSIAHYWSLTEGFQNLVLNAWLAHTRLESRPLEWPLFEYAMIGTLFSGPPFLLAWLGHLLAQRCARTLSRRRFRALACGVSLGFASLGLTLCMTPLPFYDEVPVDLDVPVVDAVTRRPIAGAFVRLTDPFLKGDPNWIFPRAMTDRLGQARLSARFTSKGERSAFRVCATFSPRGY
jgi:hypothetical protein